MEKKIISVCLVAVIAVLAITGASLAYLTDTESKDNIFTVGDVKIDLTESFDESLAHLLPATGSVENGNLKNGIQKEIFVTSKGSADAYVRVHIAVPTVLAIGKRDFDADSGIIRFACDSNTVGEGKWNWTASSGAPYEEKSNSYGTKINGIDYTVYVVTYESALTKGETTVSAMTQVYMDSAVTNEDISAVKDILGDSWHICVAAEGVQAAGFDNAYDALNNAFGIPGAYEVRWNID